MQLDVDEGIRLGVTVTPAFFINGQLIVGLSHCFRCRDSRSRHLTGPPAPKRSA
jgi:hypothetical protein